MHTPTPQCHLLHVFCSRNLFWSLLPPSRFRHFRFDKMEGTEKASFPGRHTRALHCPSFLPSLPCLPILLYTRDYCSMPSLPCILPFHPTSLFLLPYSLPHTSVSLSTTPCHLPFPLYLYFINMGHCFGVHEQVKTQGQDGFWMGGLPLRVLLCAHVPGKYYSHVIPYVYTCPLPASPYFYTCSPISPTSTLPFLPTSVPPPLTFLPPSPSNFLLHACVTTWCSAVPLPPSLFSLCLR